MKSSLTFKNGIKDGLPIGLGYFPVAFAFGVRASILSVPVYITALISMLNLTSAGQLAGLNIIASAGTIIELIVAEAIINSRYFLMSIGLSQKSDDSFNLGNRLRCSAFITDEIFAVSMSKEENISSKYFYGLSFLPYIGWALGTIFGAVAGNILPEIVSTALGIALYAMFIAIIIPPTMSNIKLLPAIILSAGISCILFFVPVLKNNISDGIAVIISAVVSAMIMAFIFPKENEKEKENA
ncbi:MAG: AzlC family ABC transporter permease [Clostridia bacterium]|nr:AzlC family ABC transporter permease [Clostridia bacterium]